MQRAVVNTRFKSSCQETNKQITREYGFEVASILNKYQVCRGRLLPAANSCSSLPLMVQYPSSVRHMHAPSQGHTNCAKHWDTVHPGTRFTLALAVWGCLVSQPSRLAL
jgi:hypothetical protein